MADTKNPAGREQVYCPAMGIGPYFRISDLPASYSTGVVAVTNQSGNFSSTVQKLGARSIRLGVQFSDTVTSCNITVSTCHADGSVKTTVKTWTGVTQATADRLYLGGQEGFDLAGSPLIIDVASFAGGGSVTELRVHKTS